MNKTFFLIIGALILTAEQALCETAIVTPELTHSLKTTTNEPNFITIVLALLFVICLIYVTGVIYSKLNVLGAKTVKEQFKNYDLSKVIILSTTQLGQGKNLHVIELNNKRYLIGAAQNSISLLKELGAVNEEKLAERKKEQDTEDIDAAIKALYGKNTKEEAKEEFIEEEEKEEDNLYKKYL